MVDAWENYKKTLTYIPFIGITSDGEMELEIIGFNQQSASKPMSGENGYIVQSMLKEPYKPID